MLSQVATLIIVFNEARNKHARVSADSSDKFEYPGEGNYHWNHKNTDEKMVDCYEGSTVDLLMRWE